MQFAKNYYDLKGKNVGSIFFELDTNYFKQILGNYKTTVNSEVYLIDSNNKILYTNTNLKIASILSDKILEQQSKNDIIVTETLSHYNWKLIIKSSKDKITEDNRIILEITLLAALLSVILELLFTTFIMKKLFKPIHFLSEGLKELTGGNFDKKISYNNKDEIGRACKDFNVLASTLKKTIDLELEYQIKVKESEYKALQSQINPHFLYNSLNSLKWMATMQHATNISEMVDSLWKLFKCASKQEGMFITLKEELDIVDSYSCIQEVRYKRKFILVKQIPEQANSFVIPKFILQPFVENSIFHGIAPKDDDGTITIKAEILNTSNGNILKLLVEDDGVGMDEIVLRNLFKSSHREEFGKGMNNIAIYNIVDRLKLLYLRDDLLHITSKVGVGTTVTILIPEKSHSQVNFGERMVKRLQKDKEVNLK